MIYFQDPQVTVHLGDVRDVLKELLEHSVDAIMTSPPYLGLRSYRAEPSIWGGDPNCQHQWGSDLVKKNAHKAGETNPGKEHYTKNDNAWTDKQGNFCLKCGCWSGVLGSEPTPELFIKHLVDIFEQCKRVLKPTGSLWVNPG